MLLGGPQNTIKSHLVFTALFCFAPFSVFSSRMSAPQHVACDMVLIFGVRTRTPNRRYTKSHLRFGAKKK
jgi:hypothetical protein